MRFFTEIFTLFAILASYTVCAAPTQAGVVRRLTNAERFARGLGPAPPVFKRVLPGVETPTRAYEVEKRAKPSGTPPVNYSGRIQIRNKDGSSLGYVVNNPSGVSGSNFGGPQNELHVTFTTTSSGAGPFDIIATNPKFPPPYFIGGAGTTVSGEFNAVSFQHVQQTSPGSRPFAGGESAIWSLNTSTKELTPQWVNPDGSKPKTFIGFDIRNNGLFLTADIANFNAHHTWPISEVHFFIVPV
ncbi:hypothetical protein NLI96_g6293 [Meripilus lineatus]|uniref:Uncharacterized protein n=1 Tax=Meripilus lineatus TaxID=2056292 RepID=A0AAD5V1C7_9APHY|nr:hypothetical protein NLI96_g6293 [Physisporinus lineatus]